MFKSRYRRRRVHREPQWLAQVKMAMKSQYRNDYAEALARKLTAEAEVERIGLGARIHFPVLSVGPCRIRS